MSITGGTWFNADTYSNLKNSIGEGYELVKTEECVDYDGLTITKGDNVTDLSGQVYYFEVVQSSD